jgi:hypothetical protein
MRRITKINLACILCLVFAVHASAQTSGNGLTGVWKYENQGREGVCIASPTHIIWIEADRSRMILPDVNPGDEAKALALSQVDAAAGEWSLEKPGRARARFLYSSNPAQVGKYSSWDFVIEGDKITYWVIDEKGDRMAPGFARRIADWSSGGDCSIHNGVWEYVDLKGIYLHSGNYGAWFIQNKPVETAGTTAAKASTFDAVNASVVVGSKHSGKKYIWNVLHAADERDEGKTYITELDASALPNMSIWFVDQHGKQTGNIIKTKRVAK